MPIVGFILGSMFGLLVAGVAWLGFGVALTAALGLYLGFGIAGGLLTLASSGSGRNGPLAPMGQALHA